MEGKDQERLVIAKPVASRPSCPNFMSFSELLSGAIDASPPSSFVERTVPIKPKTVRLKSSVHHVSVPSVSSQFQGDVSGAQIINSSDKVLKPECRSTVVYKPLAKLVSRATVSHLANLGNFEIGHQQPITPVQSQAFGQTQAQSSDHSKHHYQTQPISPYLHHKSSLQPLTNPAIESPRLASQNPEQNQRSPMPIAVGDRPSYDGYNWRKYGQKQVKGSEYPRSYYKCTHPNCPVKKKVERSLDGQIAEIVYKGEHNHKKPQPPKRLASGSQGQAFVSEGASRDSIQPLWNNLLTGQNEGSEGRMENHLPGNPTYQGKGVLNRDPMAVAFNSGIGSPENSCGLSGDFDEGSKRQDGDDEEPNRKRRKIEDKGKGGASLEQEVREPLIVVQSSTESEMVGDGFRWRKYGQKVVKGNPYPRSYYRCTSLKCNVRKHVERVSDDLKSFITTYEGKHNHDMPITRSVNPDTLGQDSQAQPPDKAKQG